MPAGMPGQSSQDFARGTSALRILHLGVRNDIGEATTDAFTQLNPVKVTTAVSSTLTGITTRGILGGSIAIARPDAGNGKVGGVPTGAVTASNRPLGLFINNAVGNQFENAPAVASNKVPFVNSMGTYGVRIYETLQQTTTGGGAVGDPLANYETGMPLYCSVNGLLTNRLNDSLEVLESISASAVLPFAFVAVAPSAQFPELVVHLRV